VLENNLKLGLLQVCVVCQKSALGPLASSGVARVPCALAQEIFLRPPSTKAIEFELKNIGAKVQKKQKQNIFYSYFALF